MCVSADVWEEEVCLLCEKGEVMVKVVSEKDLWEQMVGAVSGTSWRAFRLLISAYM